MLRDLLSIALLIAIAAAFVALIGPDAALFIHLQ